MRTRRALAVLVLVSLAMGPAATPQPAEFTARVIGVSDGDTITVLRDRPPVKVRLFGIVRGRTAIRSHRPRHRGIPPLRSEPEESQRAPTIACPAAVVRLLRRLPCRA
jgi:hypothetical protein